MECDEPSIPTIAIIVTWNSARYILSCLTSLRDSSPNTSLLVVDNASTDDTVPRVREQFPEALIVQTGANLGFAGGNNVGLHYAQRHGYVYALIANPDCAFERGCVPALVSALEGNPNLAIVSPVIFEADRRTVWYSGAEVDVRTGTSYHLTDLPSPSASAPGLRLTNRASGCAMAVRLNALDAVGLLDERYFLYYEETDLSLRCTVRDLDIAVVPSAVAFHDAGHGVAARSESYQYYMTRNRLLLVRQHSGHIFPALPHCLYTSVRNLLLALRSSPGQAFVQSGSIVKGYIDFARGRDGHQSVNFRWWPLRPKAT
jgi:hypothetical protein